MCLPSCCFQSIRQIPNHYVRVNFRGKRLSQEEKPTFLSAQKMASSGDSSLLVFCYYTT